MNKSINVFVENRSSGKPFYENLLVHELEDGTFRLLKSPDFLEGFAAADEFVWDSSNKSIKLTKRGGNVCVQCFCADATAVEKFIAPRLGPLSGSIDGDFKNQLLILTFPVSVGFSAIQALMSEMETQCPGSGFMYGNVYEPGGGAKPLNWWKK